MKLKKLLVLALTALMAFSVVGCGGGSGGGITPPGPGPTPGPGGPGGTGTQTTIKVEYLLAGYGKTAFEKMAQSFMEKNPDIKVTLVPNENVNGETGTKLQAGKNLSDVYYGEFLGSVRRWAIQGYVLPIDDVMTMQTGDGEGVTVAQNLTPYALKSREMVKDGVNHYWSLPQTMSAASFLYNKTLFDQYDLDLPTNTAELVEFCNTVASMTLSTNKGEPITPITYCGAANDGYWSTILQTWWLQASGVEKLDEFAKYDSPEIYQDQGRLRMYQVFNEIAFNTNYLPANVNSKDHTAAQKDFLEGKAFLLPCGSWFEQEMKDYITHYPDCDFRLLSCPTICDASGTPMTTTKYLWEGANDAWFIPTQIASSKVDAAKKFLAYVASDEACEIWTKYAGGVRPYNYDFSSSSELYQGLTTFQKSVCDVVSTSTVYRLNTSSPLALQGYASVNPWQYSPFVAFRDKMKTPETYFAQEYSYASSQWQTWKANVGLA